MAESAHGWRDAYPSRSASLEKINLPYQPYNLNRLPIGVIMLDLDCRVIGFSGIATAILGANRLDESLGKTLHSFHPKQFHSKLDWLLQEARNQNACGHASMLINVASLILQLHLTQISDAKCATGYCLILYDITDLTLTPTEIEPEQAGIQPVRTLLKIPVTIDGRIVLLDIANVVYFRAEGHYTHTYANGAHYFCNFSLSELVSRLHEAHLDLLLEEVGLSGLE